MASSLDIGFALDRRWHHLAGRPMRDDVDASKRSALLAVARILRDAAVPYAIIGGLAVQVHAREPRTTLDIDIAIDSRNDLPVVALRAAGIEPTGEHEHTPNWRAADGTPIQFTDDDALRPALERAIGVPLEDVELRVLCKPDLLHEKLRAGSDAARRRSKRLQDLADAEALLEGDPALDAELTAAERLLLGR